MLAHFDVSGHYAVVDERGEAVHEQDAEHHTLGIGRVDDTKHHGENANEQAIDPLARVGLSRRNRVGGHKDRTEHETAHQVMVVERHLHVFVGANGIE